MVKKEGVVIEVERDDRGGDGRDDRAFDLRTFRLHPTHDVDE